MCSPLYIIGNLRGLRGKLTHEISFRTGKQSNSGQIPNVSFSNAKVYSLLFRSAIKLFLLEFWAIYINVRVSVRLFFCFFFRPFAYNFKLQRILVTFLNHNVPCVFCNHNVIVNEYFIARHNRQRSPRSRYLTVFTKMAAE